MSEDVLVTADWIEQRLDDFQSDDPGFRLVEVNNPTVTDDSEYTPYGEGHIPGAVYLDWEDDLSDPTRRDIVSKEGFEEVNGESGITEDSTIVIYGGGRVPNWFALFAYWQYKYYGHDDIKVLDGGKGYWVENDYPLSQETPEYTPQTYSASGPFENLRAYKGDVDNAIEDGLPLVDVRSPEEYSGEVIAPEGLMETAQRGGHIPGASNVPIAETLNEDGTFRSPDELRELYESAGVEDGQSVIAYCRVGERSSIEWFLLHELLNYDDVSNYDGSWTEWGNLVNAPIETGR